MKPGGCSRLEGLLRKLETGSLRDFHRAAAGAGIVTSQPRFLTVVTDISNKCNLRCRMCYFSLDRYFKAERVVMEPGPFEKLAAAVLPAAQTLTLSCGNEPLTSPHFVDILAIAGRYRLPHLDFASNGILLNERIIDAVIRSGVTDILLSVDAARKETYEDIRRGASFDRLIENIRLLNRRKRKWKSPSPRLRFNITLMRSNIEQMEDLVVLAHRLGVEKLDFRQAVLYDGLGMEAESLSRHQALSDEYLNKAVLKAEELGLEIVAFPGYFRRDGQPPLLRLPDRGRIRRRDLLNELKDHPASFLKSAYPLAKDILRGRRLESFLRRLTGERPRPYCKLPFSYVLINTGGAVYPCPHYHEDAPYGNIFSAASFEEIWFNAAYRGLRRRILENDPPPMCLTCPQRGT